MESSSSEREEDSDRVKHFDFSFRKRSKVPFYVDNNNSVHISTYKDYP